MLNLIRETDSKQSPLRVFHANALLNPLMRFNGSGNKNRFAWRQ